MLMRIFASEVQLPPPFVEELADLLLSIGEDLHGRQLEEASLIWLRHAQTAINFLPQDQFSADAEELKFRILSRLGKSSPF